MKQVVFYYHCQLDSVEGGDELVADHIINLLYERLNFICLVRRDEGGEVACQKERTGRVGRQLLDLQQFLESLVFI